MQVRNNIEHYSNALFSIWEELEFEDQKIFTKTAKETYFSIKSNFDLIKIISSKNLTKQERKKIISNIFEKDYSENRISMYIFNFMYILIDNDFSEYILDILLGVFEKIDNHQNFIFLRVFSPYWLDENTLKRIEKMFSLKTNKKVRYENMIDKSLIGGIKICFGNEVYDYSIKGQINQIKWNIENNKEY